ncbi:MAG: DUF488 family protein, N3 subclade [Acidimicrobiales bacterium]
MYRTRVRGARVEDRLPILVDRLWPRGLRKEGAPFERWLQAVAPSTPLRIFYGHRPERFAEFAMRYRAELAADVDGGFRELVVLARREPVALLTATRDLEHSGAEVLVEELRRRLAGEENEPFVATETVQLIELLDDAHGRGVIWSLDRHHGVNANLVRLDPGESMESHVNDEVDVLLVGVAGSGVVDVDEEERTINPGSLTLVRRGSRRSITAGTEPFGYLSIHSERSGPTIRRRTVRKEGT